MRVCKFLLDFREGIACKYEEYVQMILIKQPTEHDPDQIHINLKAIWHISYSLSLSRRLWSTAGNTPRFTLHQIQFGQSFNNCKSVE